MSVRAKMKCVEIKKSAYYGTDNIVDTVVLSPVGGPENKSWAKYTPAGRVEMTIDNPTAAHQFAIGKTFFVDFTEAPATEAGEKG